ncbi:hypothetical protein MMC09_001780 [Bachmanniomyces sp. S44760]|nr:hypothetical protein [Bachmanniomyces sp. S44760]
MEIQQPRKSFAGLRNTVYDIQSLPERATSIRSKGLRAFLNIRISGLKDRLSIEEKTRDQNGGSTWLRKLAGSMERPKSRAFVAGPTTSCEKAIGSTPDRVSTQDSALEPPRSTFNPGSGAAARAAAAASNERLSPMRAMSVRLDSRVRDSRLTKDSESGIGIDFRDRTADGKENDSSIVKIDPQDFLPEELMGEIMSHLNAGSLMNAELVSRRWYSTASSVHVWRHMFQAEFESQLQSFPSNAHSLQVGGFGFGKRRPDQEWKRMWKTRKALQERWRNGHAAAIYLEGHKDSVYCVQFDEHKILTGSRDRTIRVWDAHTYECIKVLGIPKQSGNATTQEPLINPVGRGQKPFASIVPSHTTRSLPAVSVPSFHHDGSILCLQFDAEIMVTGSSDFTCIVWDLKVDYQPLHRLRHHKAGVLDVCFDHRYIISCSKDTTICVWDRKGGDFLQSLTGHRGPVNAVQLRGNLVVSASGDGVAKLWNIASGLCIKEFPSKDRGMACVEFSPDSRTILAGGNDQVIYQFDANTGELIRELKGHRGLVRSLHLDSTNGRIISGSYDSSVKAYDIHTGNMICDFTGWTTSWMLSAKADYRRIVATSQDSRAIIMDFGYQLPGIELLEG